MGAETRQQRRARERREGVVRGATSSGPEIRERKSLRSWQIAMGVVPALLLASGLGVAMSGPAYFWFGIYLTCVALIWLAVDWWLFSNDFPTSRKLLGYGCIAFIVAVVSGIAFRPAPLDTFAFALEANSTRERSSPA